MTQIEDSVCFITRKEVSKDAVLDVRIMRALP